VFDLDRSDREPHAVLTGDTLFVGDVGRPDLRVALGWSAADLGALLYDSLWTKLLPLPDSSLVYPAHGAGSLCGKAIAKETVSTIGEQRRVNYALQPMSKAAFVDLVSADQPDAPPYFTYDAVLNSRERPTLDEALARELTPMTLDETLALQRQEAQILDTREPTDFAAAHLKGSINIGLGGQYATWAGTVLDRDRPIVIVADPGRENESALRLGRIGFDHVAGYLKDGMRSLDTRPDLTATIDRLSPAVAAERLAASDRTGPAGHAGPGRTSPTGGGLSAQALLVDVRAPREREEKHLAGSVSMPLSQLTARAGELPRDRPLIVYCAGGYRSSIAASLLRTLGFSDVSEVAGGIAAWESAVLQSAPLGGGLVRK
jgi:rhodanese-related sulfurtransferase